MPVYHSGKLSKTQRPDYNYPGRPMAPDLTLPLAPRNLAVSSPYIIGMADIRWDNPAILPENNALNVLGVNVYRAIDSPEATYIKINDVPLGSLYFRDQTTEEYVVEEDATPTIKHVQEPADQWFVYTQNRAVVMPGTNGKVALSSRYVRVEIDDGDGNFLEVPAFSLNGLTGEIELISNPTFNHDVEQIIPARLPVPPGGRVRLSYTYIRHQVISKLNQRIYYKVTTVAQDQENPGGIIETPLGEVSARSMFDMEEVDWIWREGIKRNRWLLEQGGERVKIFIRKWMGEKCSSFEYTYGQSHHDCKICFGTNFIGGYEGPYDIIIAPPETERSIELADMGLHIRYDWLTWTSDYPLLNERDIIIRQNNERYIVGPVNYQGSRGAIYQQHMSISYIDEKDIRYKVSIEGGETQVPESTDLYREDRKTEASPVINEKPEVPEHRIIRGRTVTFENITWVLAMGFVSLELVSSFVSNLVLFV